VNASMTRLMRLTALRRTYVTEITETIGELLEEVTGGRGNGWGSGVVDGQALARLRCVAHKLTGTGASYGYPAVSTSARYLTCVCHDSPKSETVVTALEGIRRAVEDAAVTLLQSDAQAGAK
jgi:hypothetical protein